MARYIDADAYEHAVQGNPYVSDSMKTYVRCSIQSQPTIEAVPVIRCKDCKYWNPKNKYCEGIGNWFGIVGEWGENGFCYKAERRGEE